MGNKIQENALELGKLAEAFSRSVAIRQIYGLLNTNKVNVKKIKPSGVSDLQKAIKYHPEKIRVEIWDGNTLHTVTNLKDYNKAMDDYLNEIY